MALRIEALGMEEVGMWSSRARRTRSVWVVALEMCQWLVDEARKVRRRSVPEGIADNEKGDVLLVGFEEDVVAGRLDHLAVGYYDWTAIVGFLLWWGGQSICAISG